MSTVCRADFPKTLGYARHCPLLLAIIMLLMPLYSSGQPKVGVGEQGKEKTQLVEQCRVLYEAGRYAEAAPLCQKALNEIKASLGPSHPDVAVAANNLAEVLNAQGNLEMAEVLYRNALDVWRRQGNILEESLVLNNLASLYETRGRYDEASSLFKQSLALREKILGSDHPEVATVLNNLGSLYYTQGEYDKAEPLLQRAQRIQENRLGRDHPDVATALNNLASLYYAKGEYARSEPLLRRAISIREHSLGKENPSVAASLSNLALVLQTMGNFSEAEVLHRRALHIREGALGADHVSIAASLDNLGAIYQVKGNYAEAELFYRRALSIREKALGAEHPSLAVTLTSLASLYKVQGEYAQAASLYERALKSREKLLGPMHPDSAASLYGLAEVYRANGEYERAELLYNQSLRIREKAFGGNHPAVATSLYGLAELYCATGRFGAAEPLLQRALKIREQVVGIKHPETAASYQSLARLYVAQREYTKAEPLLLKVLRIREELLGPKHPDTASALHDLATLYFSQGKYSAAEPLYLRAFRLRETSLGVVHPDVAASLNALGNLYRETGVYGKAEEMLRSALAIREKALPPGHPDLVVSLDSLAALYLAQDRISLSVTFLAKAVTASEQLLRRYVTEAQVTQHLSMVQAEADMAYTMAARANAPEEARRLALTVALLRKGRLLDTTTQTARAILRSLATEQDREKFRLLQRLRAQFSAFMLAPQNDRRRMVELSSQIASLEHDLGGASEAFRFTASPPPPDAVVSKVAQQLTEAPLVEVVAFFPDRSRASDTQHRWGNPRYLAIVLFADQHIEASDLGDAELIDQTAARFLASVKSPTSAYRPAAEDLYRLVMQPIRHHLRGRSRVFLSLDGQLNLVPFEALHDGSTFLIDAFEFTYLSSGRDILRQAKSNSSKGQLILFADPDIDGLPTDLRTKLPNAEVTPGLANLVTGLHSLPGALKEARLIHSKFAGSVLRVGVDASDAALLKVVSPRILHLATHGIFLDDLLSPPVPMPMSRGVRVEIGFPLEKAMPSLPASSQLARSALVMAGAAQLALQPVRDGDMVRDGLVSGLEVAGMNLGNTQLVVLAACSAARGTELPVGQGVSGLRRAFLLAGAETVVASLWAVADAETVDLMIHYYGRLSRGEGRVAAMHQAALALRRSRPHPFYWAPFIVVGSGAPLGAL